MSAFSLGAAVGATGKFPKLKTAEVDDKAADRQARELAQIRGSISLKNDQYHNVYVKKMGDMSKNVVTQILDFERTRDPEVVKKSYDLLNTFNSESNYALNQSAYLKNLEAQIRKADVSNEFLPKAVKEKLLYIIETSASEDDLFGKIKENPDIFREGYVIFDPKQEGLKALTITPHNKYDFSKLMYNDKLFDRKSHMVLISETIEKNDKERSIDRYFTVPKDRIEAMQLYKTDKTVTIENNAFDLGKKWFLANPNAQKQYKATLYETGELQDGDAAETDVNELYRMFFKQHIIPAIPKQYENKDQFVPRYQTTIINNMGERKANVSFSQGPTRLNYLQGKELFSPNTVFAATDPDGVDVQVAQNRFVLSLDTGKAELVGTSTRSMKIANIGLYPTIIVEDSTRKDAEGKPMKSIYLLSEDQQQTYDKAGKKYMMLPFAIGTGKSLEIGQLPDVSKRTYALPLFEPGADNRFVVDQSIRNAKTVKGSPLLDQIIQRNKWDDMTLANWTISYLNMMKEIRDENDLTQGVKK